jgi:hypothetical protein
LKVLLSTKVRSMKSIGPVLGATYMDIQTYKIELLPCQVMSDVLFWSWSTLLEVQRNSTLTYPHID